MQASPWWASRKRPTGGQRQAVFEVLDGRLGDDCVEDYDSPEDALQAAIEIIQEYDDELMLGCGVGPLMTDIKDWMREWTDGRRAEPVSTSTLPGASPTETTAKPTTEPSAESVPKNKPSSRRFP